MDLLNFQVLKNKTLNGKSREWTQPSSLQAYLFGFFFTGTMNSKVSGREWKVGKLKVTTSSSFHQTTFFPICYMHPANLFNEGENLFFHQIQWEIIAKQGSLLPRGKTANCLTWWIFRHSTDIWNCTSISLYLNAKMHPKTKVFVV